MPIYRVEKLISDFDETISQKDTIQSLVTAAMQKRAVNEFPTMEEWKQTVEWYRVHHSHRCDKWLNSNREHGQVTIVDFLSDIKSLETASIGRVTENRFLAGLTKEELRKAGSQVQKHEAAGICLSEMRSAGVTVEILTANWSQTFVEEAVRGFCDTVIANRLQFDQRGISTGEIELRVLSAHDKWRHFKSHRSKTGLTGYIGDSISDLRAILEADIGILIGENQTCLRVIDRFRIPIKRVTQASRQVVNGPGARTKIKQIFHADSWETVNQLLQQPAVNLSPQLDHPRQR